MIGQIGIWGRQSEIGTAEANRKRWVLACATRAGVERASWLVEALERRRLLSADFGTAQMIGKTGDLTFPLTVQAADFNGDGKLDVVAKSSEAVVWYPNLGGGSFGPARVVATNMGYSRGMGDLAVGDVNGDGKPDVVAVSSEYPASNPGLVSRVTWYQYDTATDTWTEHVVSDGSLVGLWPAAVVDIDKDGDADIVSSSYTWEGTIRVVWFENQNNGSSWKAHTICEDDSIAEGSRTIAVGDFDKDGWPDLLVGARFAQSVVEYRNPHDPQNARQPWVATVLDSQMNEMTGVAAADLNQDGTLDAIAVTDNPYDPVGASSRARIAWYANDPAHPGTFGPANILAPVGTIQRPWYVDATDLDQDGDPDLLIGSINHVDWYENLGGGNFAPLKNIGSDCDAWVRTADLNGDGLTDVLAVNAHGNRIVWYPGKVTPTPFLGHPFNISTDTIEAENFDNGGEGVAFHDSTPKNILAAYRSTAVDVGAIANASNGFGVGYTAPGEWLGYSITAPTTGAYSIQARVANYKAGGTFHIEVDGQNVTGAMSVPDTGPWDTWQTITSKAFNITAGTHLMRVVMDTGGYWGNIGDFDSFRFVQPFHGVPFNVNTDTIEAEDFDNGGEGVAYHDSTPQNIPGKYRNTPVDIAAVSNASNGYAVGYTYPGEWLGYTINASAQGSYVLEATVANYQQGGTFHVEIDGRNVTGALTVPDTGPWDTWRTLTSPTFSIPAGTHLMKVVMDRPGYWGNIGDFDSYRFVEVPVPFHGSPFNLTDPIQAEDFDSGSDGVAYHDTTPQNIPGNYRNTGVDINAGGGNGYDVGYTAPGEWLKYSVANPTAGTFVLRSSVASSQAGGTFHVELDGQNVTGAMSVPDTGGWFNFQTVASRKFSVSAGQHIMRVVMDSAGYWGAVGNFDMFQFVPAGNVSFSFNLTTGTSDPIPSQLAPYVQFLAPPADTNGDGARDALLKINLNDPALANPYKSAVFQIHYGSQQPLSGMTVNIGDSVTNDRFGGDGATQSNDAEVNIGAPQYLPNTRDLYAFGKDGTPVPLLVQVPNFIDQGYTVVLAVGDGAFAYSNGHGLASSLFTPALFCLKGQPDLEGPVNYDIYAGFNRSVAGDRFGAGIDSVTITLSPSSVSTV